MPSRRAESFNTLRSNTLVIWADQGRADEMKAVLKAGADPNARDERGNPGLVLAARRGHIEAVRVLLNARADPNAGDINELTPLYWAAYKDHPRVVEALLEADASPHVQDRDGRTPLHWVSYNRGFEHRTCRALLKAGADSSTPDNAGWRPQHRPRCNPYNLDQDT